MARELVPRNWLFRRMDRKSPSFPAAAAECSSLTARDQTRVCFLLSTPSFRSCMVLMVRTAQYRAHSNWPMFLTLDRALSDLRSRWTRMSPSGCCRMRGCRLPASLSVTTPSAIGYEDAVRAVGTKDLFVKPANMGSSVGVSRARTAEEFSECCKHAFRFDKKILIEQCVPSVREIECSVLEDANGDVRASELGEIVPDNKHGFYSYDAKYIDAGGASLVVPARLPPELSNAIKSAGDQDIQGVVLRGNGTDRFLPERSGCLRE